MTWVPAQGGWQHDGMMICKVLLEFVSGQDAGLSALHFHLDGVCYRDRMCFDDHVFCLTHSPILNRAVVPGELRNGEQLDTVSVRFELENANICGFVKLVPSGVSNSKIEAGRGVGTFTAAQASTMKRSQGVGLKRTLLRQFFQPTEPVRKSLRTQA